MTPPDYDYVWGAQRTVRDRKRDSTIPFVSYFVVLSISNSSQFKAYLIYFYLIHFKYLIIL